MKFSFFRLAFCVVLPSLLFFSCAGTPPVQEADPGPAAESEYEPSKTESTEKSTDAEIPPVADVPASSGVPDVPADVPEVSPESEAAEVSAEISAEEEAPPASLKTASDRKLKKNFDKPPEPGKIINESEVEPADETAEDQVDKPEIKENTPLSAPIPVHNNPLLVEDRPYQAEEKVVTTVPAAAAALAPPAAPTAPVVESDISNPLSAAATETVETAVPELLEDPAVSAASPSRLLESPGEFTITMEGLGWIFRSDRSTPGSWRFLERELKGDSTIFRFLFTESGDWNLVFERQDLSSGGSEDAFRNVIVGEDDGLPHIDNGPLPESYDNPIPGMLPGDSESRNLAARDAADKGRFEDAMKFWEVDASRDDEDGRRARAALVESAVQSDSINPLITWLPRYMNENPESSVLADALDIFEAQAGYDEKSRMILEKLAVSDKDGRQAEWLYRLALYLEKPGDNRDLDRSAALYQEVITSWPLSEWRDRSEERLLWLQRHYFRVR